MKEWVFSIVFTVLITSVVGLISPEGRLGKLIKGVFSIIILLVVIKPIIKIQDSLAPFDLPSVNIDQELQYDFIDFINAERIKKLENDCKDIILNKNFDYVKVQIDYSVIENNQISINFVKIILNNKVINPNNEHIVIKEDLSKIIASYLCVDEKKVFFYE